MKCECLLLNVNNCYNTADIRIVSTVARYTRCILNASAVNTPTPTLYTDTLLSNIFFGLLLLPDISIELSKKLLNLT